jgi:hypothetical protein
MCDKEIVCNNMLLLFILRKIQAKNEYLLSTSCSPPPLKKNTYTWVSMMALSRLPRSELVTVLRRWLPQGVRDGNNMESVLCLCLANGHNKTTGKAYMKQNERKTDELIS